MVARLGSIAATVGLLTRPEPVVGNGGGCRRVAERGPSFDIVCRREANFFGGGPPSVSGAEAEAVSPLETFRPKSPLNLLLAALLLLSMTPVDLLLSFFWRLSTYASNPPKSLGAIWSTLAASSTALKCTGLEARVFDSLNRRLEEALDSLNDGRATTATSSCSISTAGVTIEESVELVLVGERAGKLVLVESGCCSVSEKLGFVTDPVDDADGWDRL